MKIKNILWPTDGSDESEYALKYAGYIAGITGASVTGLHVIPSSVDSLMDSLRSDDEFKDWIQGVEENTVKRFSSVEKNMQKAGIKFEGVLLRGVPEARIREYARQNGADLIVMGKHGHGFIESLVVGSETMKVLRKSHIPVLSVKDEKKKRAVSFKNILVPLDFYECNESALLSALDIASMTGASVTAVYALRLDMYAQDIPSGALRIVIQSSQKELREQVRSIKEKFSKSRKVKDVEVKTEVIHGLNASVSITDYASRKNSDLIVIHTHGRTGVRKFLLGSVTEKVINHAPCSVLAIGPE